MIWVTLMLKISLALFVLAALAEAFLQRWSWAIGYLIVAELLYALLVYLERMILRAEIHEMIKTGRRVREADDGSR